MQQTGMAMQPRPVPSLISDPGDHLLLSTARGCDSGSKRSDDIPLKSERAPLSPAMS
jgi:hypothetical protein